MTTEQVSLPSNSCKRCACPTLPSTVRSPSAARSRMQRDKRPAPGSTAERRPRMPGAALHSCWHGDGEQQRL
eukprot:3059288-Prymnesium_polylepis.1